MTFPFDHGTAAVQTLARTTPQDLDLAPGDRLIYAYVYSPGDLSEARIENGVELTVVP